jgi:ribosomal protein S15P/S13E
MVDKNVGVSRTLPDPNSGIATASATSSNYSDGSDAGAKNNSLHNRFAMLKNKEIPMNFAELRKRAEARKQAYHQGTEDPAKALPYEKMGDADKIRDTQDKQMTGKELDTSKDIPAEDAKKKEMLQRASLEERRAKRARLLKALTKEAADDKRPGAVEEKTDSLGRKVMVATKADGTKEVLKADDKEGAVEKKAYWQGTEEPTPGKAQYPLMGEPHEKMRMKDKQMNGSVESGADGMFPGDEQTKRGLQRMASIRARLTKSATPGQSAWKFFSGNNEILTVRASSAYEVGLDEPVKNTAHLSQDGKDLVADDFFKTEAYAKEVMKLIRSAGLEKAAETLGGELPASPAAPAAPEAPAAEAPATPRDTGKDKIAEALASIESAVEEIRNAANIEDLKQVDVAAEGAPVAASFRTQLLKVQAELAEAADELGALSTVSAPVTVVDEAVSDALVVATAAADLLDKFAAKKKKKRDDDKKSKKDKSDKKAKGKDREEDESEEKDDDKEEKDDDKEEKGIEKAGETLAALLAARAARREALVAQAFTEGEDEWEEATKPEIPSLLGHGDTEEDSVVDELEDGLDAAEELAEALRAWDAEDGAMAAKDAGDMPGPLNKAEEKEVAEIADKKADEEVREHEKDMHAKDGLMDRKAWRESLLKKIAGEWQSTYSEARKGSGPDVAVDAKVSDKLNKVETLAEVKEAVEDVAKSEPRNVRMAAEALDRMIRAGVVKAAQIDELVAKGAVDAVAAKYWKDYLGQVDGGREFATGLTQEFKQAKAGLEVKAASEEQEAKLMRAYNLALEAQERGLIAKSRADLHRFASNLVKLPGDQFDAMKNMIGQARKTEEQVKTAAPVVGLNYDRSGATPAAPQTADVSVENLAKLFF